jgi:hypothetical protein
MYNALRNALKLFIEQKSFVRIRNNQILVSSDIVCSGSSLKFKSSVNFIHWFGIVKIQNGTPHYIFLAIFWIHTQQKKNKKSFERLFKTELNAALTGNN